MTFVHAEVLLWQENDITTHEPSLVLNPLALTGNLRYVNRTTLFFERSKVAITPLPVSYLLRA